MVVDGQDLGRMAAGLQGDGLVDDHIDGAAGAGQIKIVGHHGGAAAAVDQMIEADPGDVLGLHQGEDAGDLVDVVAGDGEAETDLEAGALAGPDPFQGPAERAADSAEVVVGRLQAIQADAGIGDAGLLEPDRHRVIDERPVGRHHRAHAGGHRPPRQFRQIRPHQGFAAGEQQHGGAEAGQIIDQGQRLGVAQVVGRSAADIRAGIAMDAGKIAAAGAVPHHDRLLVGGKLQQMAGQLAGMTPIAEGIGRFDGAQIKF